MTAGAGQVGRDPAPAPVGYAIGSFSRHPVPCRPSKATWGESHSPHKAIAELEEKLPELREQTRQAKDRYRELNAVIHSSDHSHHPELSRLHKAWQEAEDALARTLERIEALRAELAEIMAPATAREARDRARARLEATERIRHDHLGRMTLAAKGKWSKSGKSTQVDVQTQKRERLPDAFCGCMEASAINGPTENSHRLDRLATLGAPPAPEETSPGRTRKGGEGIPISRAPNQETGAGPSPSLNGKNFLAREAPQCSEAHFPAESALRLRCLQANPNPRFLWERPWELFLISPVI